MTQMEAIKTLADYDEATLARAMQEVRGTEEAKAKALEEIRRYKEMRNIIAGWFRK